MHGSWNAKNSHRDYVIARNFGGQDYRIVEAYCGLPKLAVDFSPQWYFFVCVLNSVKLVRISKTRYRWKDLSLLMVLKANWVQETTHASLHMERKRPIRSSKG